MSRSRTSTEIALSQHRLRNSTVAARIVASTGLSPPCPVYEWGAGDGALTVELALRKLQVVAVERDRGEWSKLKTRLQADSNVTPVLGDFRDESLPREEEYAVVANLPYSLTSDAMRMLLQARNPPVSAHLIMQREAAFRWAGVGRHTVVSVTAHVRAEIDIVLALHRRDFSPRPNVDSVLVRLRFHERPLLPPNEERAFSAFVQKGFGAGRRTLLKNLGGAVSYRAFGEISRQHDFGRDTTPGEISMNAWTDLFRRRSAKADPAVKPTSRRRSPRRERRS